jgi:FkbM family methyltransferase
MLYSFTKKFLYNDFTGLIAGYLKKNNNYETIIFDVGCNTGDFSIKIKKKLKTIKSKFFLFDPNPHLNITDFNYHKIALSNQIGLSDFYLNEFMSSGGSSLKTIVKDDKLWRLSRKIFTLNFKKNNFLKIKVQSDTLDNFCQTNKIDKIDILKIDVEGSELDILMGSPNMLKKTYLIQIEILEKKENFENFYSKVRNFLENEFGYRLVVEKNIWTLSLFSGMRGKDVLFIKKK